MRGDGTPSEDGGGTHSPDSERELEAELNRVKEENANLNAEVTELSEKVEEEKSKYK